MLEPFVCPSCRAPGCNVIVDDATGELGVTHPLPQCPAFERLEPHDFLRAANDLYAAEHRN